MCSENDEKWENLSAKQEFKILIQPIQAIAEIISYFVRYKQKRELR